MSFTIRKAVVPISGTAILETTIPERGDTVFDTLVAQAAERDVLRGSSGLDFVDPDYVAAERVLKPEDIGSTVTFLGSVYDSQGNMVVNEKGQVISTLTDDDWSFKRGLTQALAEELSKASGEDVRVMDAELHSLLTTEALRQGNFDALALLDYTECVGTPMFTVDGQARCAYGVVDVCDRGVHSSLDDDYSDSNYASRLVLVRAA